jgi:hypothetical protein
MPGGGSKPGERRGGRKKGQPNKVTLAKEAIVAAGGITPLDYMLKILRDATRTDEERMDAAKAAAPYSHARLQSVDNTHRHSFDLGSILDADA